MFEYTELTVDFDVLLQCFLNVIFYFFSFRQQKQVSDNTHL